MIYGIRKEIVVSYRTEKTEKHRQLTLLMSRVFGLLHGETR